MLKDSELSKIHKQCYIRKAGYTSSQILNNLLKMISNIVTEKLVQ